MKSGFYAILAEFEKKMCKCAIETAKGNVNMASEVLGVNRTTLLQRCASFGIDVNQFREEGAKQKERSKTKIKPREPGKNILKDKHVWNSHKRAMIIDALKDANYNRTKAAEALGMGLRTIRYYIVDLREKGVDIPDSPLDRRKE